VTGPATQLPQGVPLGQVQEQGKVQEPALEPVLAQGLVPVPAQGLALGPGREQHSQSPSTHLPVPLP